MLINNYERPELRHLGHYKYFLCKNVYKIIDKNKDISGENPIRYSNNIKKLKNIAKEARNYFFDIHSDIIFDFKIYQIEHLDNYLKFYSSKITKKNYGIKWKRFNWRRP